MQGDSRRPKPNRSKVRNVRVPQAVSSRPCSAPADQQVDGHAEALEPKQTETGQGSHNYRALRK